MSIHDQFALTELVGACGPEYHKIQTLFLRDPETKFKTLLHGEYAHPEFEYLASTPWAFTEKVDGTNIRVALQPHCAPQFAGKADNSQLPAPLAAWLQSRFPEPPPDLNQTIFLYGEGYGPGIQKAGKLYGGEQRFVLFDIYTNGVWLSRDNVEAIGQQLDLEVVPVIGTGTLHDLVDVVRNGFTSQWGDFAAEGIVARPVVELQTRRGFRIITKLKTRDFPR